MPTVSLNVPEFKLQLSKFAQKAEHKTQEFFTGFSQELSSEVSEATPVKTGFLRRSWHVTINGAKAEDVTQLKLGDIFGYVNTAVYGARLEFGFVGTDSLGRKYNQAPRAFVRDTVARADIIASEVLAKIGAT